MPRSALLGFCYRKAKFNNKPNDYGRIMGLIATLTEMAILDDS